MNEPTCYFLTGTGRCGTMLFARLFSSSKTSLCEHEKIFQHDSMIRFFRDGDTDAFRVDLRRLGDKVHQINANGMSYGVSSGHLYFAISRIHEMFGDRARFVLLVKKPEEFVRSALARGFFDPSHPRCCMQLEVGSKNDVRSDWAKWGPFEKCLWYWNMVNDWTMKEFSRLPAGLHRIVRIEDLDVDLAMELCGFVGIRDMDAKKVGDMLARRINTSPSAAGKTSDDNPYSVPISMPAFPHWDEGMKTAMERLAGKCRKAIYGACIPNERDS